MGKWEMVRLGDIGTIVTGSTPPKKEAIFYDSDDIPFFKPNDFSEDTIKKLTIPYEYVSEKARKKTRLLPVGSVLVTCIGTIGKVGIATCESTCNQQINAIIPHDKVITSEYLANVVLTRRAYLKQIANAPVVPIINKSNFSEVLIPLPPLVAQKRIAKNLDLASEIVKGYKEQLAELDKLVQSVFYEMFGDPVTNEMGWDVTCLSEVCKKITDGTHNSPENLETGEYRYITAKNIKRDGILLSNITYVTKQVHEEIYARCNPEMGDVLYIKDGVTTGIAVVNTLNEPFSMLSSVALLKLKNTICNKYLCNALNCKEMYQKIRENMGGAAITRLTLVKIKNIEIPLPPLSLQTRFASIVTEIETQKAQIQKALSEAENLFNSLMQEYFE